MTIVWFTLAILLVLFGVPSLIGLMLPERFLGSAEVEYDKTPDEVWLALLDYTRAPMTGKMMKATVALPGEDGLPAWEESMGHGETITVRTTVSEKPTRMVRTMESAASPMTSTWNYALEPIDGGCRLRMEGETLIPLGDWKSPIFRFMMQVGGGVKKGFVIQMDMAARTLGVDARHAS